MNCSLSACRSPAHPGSSFCSGAHEQFFQSGSQQQLLCAFPYCKNSAFVGYSFCSLLHCASYYNQASLSATCMQCGAQAHLGSNFCSVAHECEYMLSVPALNKSASSCALAGCNFEGSMQFNGFCCNNHKNAQNLVNMASNVSGTSNTNAPVANNYAPKASNTGNVNQSLCANSGCNKPSHSGFAHCSKRCAAIATIGTGCKVTKLTSSDAAYTSVEHQFSSKWNPKPAPNVRSIYAIFLDKKLVEAYEDYKEKVIKMRPNSKAVQKGWGSGGPGNEQRRFHGTAMTCGFAGGHICNSSSCAMCRIIETGFKVSKASSGGLYGAGTYSSSQPDKSDVYNHGSKDAFGKGTKCMFLCSVVIGVGYERKGSQRFTKPPAGYDSVLGSITTDEAIVYEDEAAIPRYVIVYDT